MSGRDLKKGCVALCIVSLTFAMGLMGFARRSSSQFSVESLVHVGQERLESDAALVKGLYRPEHPQGTAEEEVYYWNASSRTFLKVLYSQGKVKRISGDPLVLSYGQMVLRRGDSEEKIKEILGAPWTRTKVGECWGLEFPLMRLYLTVSPADGLQGVRLGG